MRASRLNRYLNPALAWSGAVLLLAGCSSDRLPQSVREQIEQQAATQANAQREQATATPLRQSVPPSVAPSPSDRTPRLDRALRALNSPAFRPLQEWTLQETAEHALGRMGAAAVPYLSAKLRYEDPDAKRQSQVRRRAAEVLAQIGPEAQVAVPDLIEALNDPSLEVRKSAAFALGQIGPEASSAVPALLQVMLETDGSVQVGSLPAREENEPAASYYSPGR